MNYHVFPVRAVMILFFGKEIKFLALIRRETSTYPNNKETIEVIPNWCLAERTFAFDQSELNSPVHKIHHFFHQK